MTTRSRPLVGLASALLALVVVVFASYAALAAPASAFGPLVKLGQARDGYVGALTAIPDHGKAGTPFTIKGEKLPPNQEFQLIWRTVEGRWKVTETEYKGREFVPTDY